MKHHAFSEWFFGVIVAVLGISLSGCQSFTSGPKTANNKKDSSWNWFKKPEYQTPHSMAALWKEDTLTVPGMPTARGFGGRIYFYDQQSKVIPVEGELVVHAFDESHKTVLPDGSEPAEKTFRFTAEQFTEHFSVSDLGASYSVWLPWDGLGGEMKKLTLIPTFKTKAGAMVQGQPSKVTLPGKSPLGLPEDAEFAEFSKVHMASTKMPTNTAQLMALMGDPSSQVSGLQTTTINVPNVANSQMSVRNAKPINNNVISDQAEMRQQAANLQKQYYENTLRAMQTNNIQTNNSLAGHGVSNVNSPAFSSSPSNAGSLPNTGLGANTPRPTGPQIPNMSIPSNAFNSEFALGPFGPINGPTEMNGPSAHSVWNQSPVPASAISQPTTYLPR